MAQIEDDFAAYTTIGERVAPPSSAIKKRLSATSQGPKFGVPAKLEPFTLLAKSVRGAGAVNLISQAISAPGVFVFSELLQVQSIAELASSEQHAKHHKLLELFAYGTWSDYTAARNDFPALTPEQEYKLKQLTILSLASQTRTLSYSDLASTLDMTSVPELEDLLIESIYSNIFTGRLDQLLQRVEILSSLGRDVRTSATPPPSSSSNSMQLEQLQEEADSGGGSTTLRTTTTTPSIATLLSSLESWQLKIDTLLGSLDHHLATLNANSVNQTQKSLQHEAKVIEMVNQIAGTKAAGGGPKGTPTVTGTSSASTTKGKDRDVLTSMTGPNSSTGGVGIGGGEGDMEVDNPQAAGTTRSAMSPSGGVGQRHRKRGRV